MVFIFVDLDTVMFFPHDLCYVCWDPMDYKNYVQIAIDIYYGLFEIDVELCNIYIIEFLI